MASLVRKNYLKRLLAWFNQAFLVRLVQRQNLKNLVCLVLPGFSRKSGSNISYAPEKPG